MVTRLIEPDELEKVLRPILTDESCPLHIAAEIDMNIDLMPKVDAVPVIRCGFCRYYNSVGYCALHQTEMSKTDFCSYGKKDGDHRAKTFTGIAKAMAEQWG